MKRTLKILVCLVSIAVICSFFGCSKENEEIIGGADNKTSIIVSESTTVNDIGKSVSYVLSEDEAKEKAYAALKQDCDNGKYSSIDKFEFAKVVLYNSDEGCIAFNRGYGDTSETENFTGHSYYAVSFEDTSQIASFAYYCIDAINGDLLFGSYMGD